MPSLANFIDRLTQWQRNCSRWDRFGVQFPGRSNQMQCGQRLVIAATFLFSSVAQTPSSGDRPRHSFHAFAHYGQCNESVIFFSDLQWLQLFAVVLFDRWIMLFNVTRVLFKTLLLIFAEPDCCYDDSSRSRSTSNLCDIHITCICI